MTKQERAFQMGLYPTAVTPFTQSGRIDYPAMGRLLHWFGELSMDGVFAVCQSSEMFFLTDAEKLELAAFCIDACRRMGMRCVVSGHTQDTAEEQADYLNRLEKLGPDAIILVTNRLAAKNEPDAAWIGRLDALVETLSSSIPLGLYECPYPYKRLLSLEIIDHVAKTGRFAFLKDTCCDTDEIRRRLSRLQGSGIALYNANAATLLPSLADGAAGYSGVLLNCMPEMFAQLRASIQKCQKAHDVVSGAPERIASFLSMASLMEYQNYPVNAKHWLVRRRILDTTLTRTGKPPLTASQRLEIDDLMRQYAYALSTFSRHIPHEMLFEANAFFVSCHASSILPLENGDLMAAYFAGSHESADDVGIWLSCRRSGKWLAPKRIAKVTDTAHWNPVLFSVSGGVRIVFKVGRGIDGWQSYTMHTVDGGETFSAPEAYAGNNPAGGPVRSKPIRVGGRLLAPNSDETEDVWTARIDVSDDEGVTFQRLSQIPLNVSDPARPGYIKGKGAIQPTLWEGKGGAVHALLRTTCGRIFRADSADGGKTWCEAYDTGLPGNNSGIDVAVWEGALYLAMNPTCGNFAPRTPLVVLRSLDNGRTFMPFATLEDSPYNLESGQPAEFSYPAIVAKDACLHISFTHMRTRIAYAAIPLQREA